MAENVPMMREFDFEGHNVRIADRQGNPWWILADVCKALGLTNPSLVAMRMDDDEVLTLSNAKGQTGHGGAQKYIVINESGLYSLILTSRKPEAKRFKKWITGTVLPAIRKTGSYIVGEEKVQTLAELNEIIIASYEKKAALLEQRNTALEAENAALVPDANVARATFNLGRLPKVGHFARQLDGVNSIAIKHDLKRSGYLYRDKFNNPYRVYSQYRGKLFVEKRYEDQHGNVDIFITPQGQRMIEQLHREGKLTMKKGYKSYA